MAISCKKTNLDLVEREKKSNSEWLNTEEAQRSYGISTFGDFQDLIRQGYEQPDLSLKIALL